MGSNDFEAHLAPHARSPLRRGRVTTLQLNIGKRCNLACHHCHVESGPRRTEMLDRAGAERVLELLEANPGLECLDITGGAPELNPHFRFIVERARALGRRVVDRCNLTVLYEPGQGDTAEFLADQGVEVVASLPCYTRETLERQRGRGVFAKSIEALRWLNQLGYAKPGRGLRLDLVYNPVGPALPPEQGQLEERYRVELRELFGIEFDALLTLANAPIKRFARQLHCLGRYEEYLSLLVNHFNPDTLPGLMCRSLLSVDHDGRLYDCDFNQALELELGAGARTIWDLEDLAELDGARIATGSHCFACTAGAGSSCSGALVS
jgi:radical SAM/Cys-rich protein